MLTMFECFKELRVSTSFLKALRSTLGWDLLTIFTATYWSVEGSYPSFTLLKMVRKKVMTKVYLELKPEPKVFPRIYLPRLANLTSTAEDSMFI